MIIWWCHFLEKEKQTNILIRNNEVMVFDIYYEY